VYHFIDESVVEAVEARALWSDGRVAAIKWVWANTHFRVAQAARLVDTLLVGNYTPVPGGVRVVTRAIFQ
jgi:hypothetical protein